MIHPPGNRMSREIARHDSLRKQVEQTQTQISTGVRYARRSDAPLAHSRADRIDQDQANVTSWSRNVEFASARVAQADGVFANSSERLAHAQQLMVSLSGPTIDATARAAIADELDGLAQDIDALAATTAPGGEPLFQPGLAGRTIRFDQNSEFAPIGGRDTAFAIGGRTLSAVLRDAANAVRSGSTAAQETAQQDIAAAIDHMANQQAQVGRAGARLDRIGSMLAERDVALAAERSAHMDTDLSAAIAELNSRNVTLEAAQAAFARINRQTLFDILR